MAKPVSNIKLPWPLLGIQGHNQEVESPIGANMKTNMGRKHIGEKSM